MYVNLKYLYKYFNKIIIYHINTIVLQHIPISTLNYIPQVYVKYISQYVYNIIFLLPLLLKRLFLSLQNICLLLFRDFHAQLMFTTHW